uniref:Uncharacterized protein n=2 Tax=Anas TaxID=8835 RepID=A0A8B9UZB4_9AVES
MLPTIFFLELLFKTTAFLRDCCSSNRFRAPKLFLFQTKTTSGKSKLTKYLKQNDKQ